jgi:hypothetical protein
MALNLFIKQAPLSVTPSHSDHTWNVVLNDYSAYTDIRLVVDVYKNPYRNDSGSTQDSGRVSRLLIPSNEFGNCIFNVETIIYNLVDKNPRSLGVNPSTVGSGLATTNPFEVLVATSSGTPVNLQTNHANITNARTSTLSFSNGFNGGVEGFDNIYHINEYRLIFGIQFTSGGTTQIVIPTNYSAYTSYTGGTISVTDASTQPYGVMIWPGVQDNKERSSLYYYSGTNLTGQYNYLNTRVYDWKMDLSQKGQFMSAFGSETIPMTINGSQVYQTRYRTHYYKCPIIVGFMYGGNPLYNNTSAIAGISYLQKTQTNNQINYDVIQTVPVNYTSRVNSQNDAPYSYLSQRIAYGIFKQNENVRTDSDVAIYLADTCAPDSYNLDSVSEIVQYKMVGDECFNDPVSFLFLNRNGVWDTFTFTKKYTKKYAVDKKVYNSQKTLNTQWWNRQSYDSQQTVFWGQAAEQVTVDSGFVQQNDVVVIEELLMSPYVYQIMDNWLPGTNQDYIYPYLIPCIVENKEVKEYIQKYQRIFQYTIELTQTPYRPFILPF